MGCFEPPPVFPRPGAFRLPFVHFPEEAHSSGAVDKWTKEMAAEFYEAGIKKLICRLTTCIERNCDYVEK